MKLLGINKTIFVTNIAKGICRLGGLSMPVLFNVYQVFPNAESTTPICWVGNSVVAFEKKIGRGEAVVIGDSSLIINYLVLDTRYGSLDTYFIKQLVGHREILIYEGNRACRIMHSLKGIMMINAIMTAISSATGIFLNRVVC